MGRDARDPEAGADFVRDLVRHVDGQRRGNNRCLRRGSERAVGLGAVDPHAASDSTAVHVSTNRFDDAGAVAVRHNLGKGHLRAEPTATLLDVARVDAREPQPDAHLARTGFGRRQIPDLEDWRQT
jgi:hypothetical protein